MKELTDKEIIAELDKMNKDSFKYIGLRYQNSGSRVIVERHKLFIAELNANPIEKIKLIIDQKRKKEIYDNAPNNTITLFLDEGYVNIYKVEDIKEKFAEQFTPHKCIVILGE